MVTSPGTRGRPREYIGTKDWTAHLQEGMGLVMWSGVCVGWSEECVNLDWSRCGSIGQVSRRMECRPETEVLEHTRTARKLQNTCFHQHTISEYHGNIRQPSGTNLGYADSSGSPSALL